MHPFSIVLVLIASAQLTEAIPATVERESATIPSRLLTGVFNRVDIQPTHLLFNTSPDRRSVANDSIANQSHTSTTASTSTTTRTTTTQASSATKSDGLLSVQLLKTIDSSSDADSSSGKVHRLFRRQAACRSPGGCVGDRCWTEDECSEGLTCLRARCRRAMRRLPERACTWAGHCDGATCQTENDCSDDRICINGRCGSANQQSNANANPGRNGNRNRNPNSGQLPTQNVNQNWNPNVFNGFPTSGATNVAGSGGNGFVIINVSGGNGGGGGSTFAVPRK